MAQNDWTAEDEAAVAAAFVTLSDVGVPDGLHARILADFDRVVARRRQSWTRSLFDAFETLWPGAPGWRPAVALSLSLIVGLVVGALLPSASHTVISVDQIVQVSDIATDQDTAGDYR
jgi:hypothetical protein